MAVNYHLRILSGGRASFNLRELWDFRGLLAALAIRDIRLRYRQTALGVAWVVLQPLPRIRGSRVCVRDCSGHYQVWEFADVMWRLKR
jgi:hypothetical protein